MGLVTEYGLAVRVWLGPGRRAMRQRGLLVIDNDFLDSFSLNTEGKTDRYCQLLRDLPTGLNEWAVHPALADDDAQVIAGGWPVRRTDYEFLTSPHTHEVLRQEGIVVIDYRPIQQAWTKTNGPR